MTDQHHAAAAKPHDAAPPGPHAGADGPHGTHGPTAPGTPAGGSGGAGPAGGSGSPTGGAAGGPADPPEPRKLRRERQHKMLGGVCSGLGRHCDMDPVIFRIGLCVLAATGGLGLIFYGFAWLLLPLEEEETEGRKLLTGRVSGSSLTALLLALVGCGVFLTMLNNGGVLTFAVVLGLLLTGAGYWSQQRRTTDPDPVTAQTVADAPPEAQAPPVTTPSWWRDPIVKDGTHTSGTDYFWGPADLKDIDIEMATARWEPRADGTVPAHDRPKAKPTPRGPRWLGGWVLLLALLAGGLGTSLSWGDGTGGSALSTSLQTGLACALAVFGLGIAVSSFLGRTGAGSIILAVLTAALLAGATALPENISTRWVRTDWKPAAVSEVQPTYEVGSGVATVDLSDIRLDKGQTITTEAQVGAGRVHIVVPRDATVRLDASVGVGDIQLPTERPSDVDIAPGQDRNVTLTPPESGKDGDQEGGTIELTIEVGVGQAEVTRAAS